MKRNCDNCKKEYEADERNIKRGWGLCCSKSCAASKREKSRPDYNPETVAANNHKRIHGGIDENHYGVFRGKRTSEGYKIYYDEGTKTGTAIDEFDNPIYTIN